MNLILLSIPDDTAQWSRWLEQQLVGLELRDLVTQLKTISPETSSKSFDEVCGPQLDQILENGLQVLSVRQIGTLLENPEVLFELQERIFFEDPKYWRSVPRSKQHTEWVETELSGIQRKLDESTPTVRLAESSTKHSNRKWYLTSIAAIAALLLIAFSLQWFQPSAPSWGFSRAQLASSTAKDDAYFELLADAAGDWFNKRPESKELLSQRLVEFEKGCETLINIPHPQLSNPDDRQWLVSKCKDWLAKIVQHRIDLDTGAKTLDDVRDAADQTIRDLQKALRSRLAASKSISHTLLG